MKIISKTNPQIHPGHNPPRQLQHRYRAPCLGTPPIHPLGLQIELQSCPETFWETCWKSDSFGFSVYWKNILSWNRFQDKRQEVRGFRNRDRKRIKSAQQNHSVENYCRAKDSSTNTKSGGGKPVYPIHINNFFTLYTNNYMNNPERKTHCKNCLKSNKKRPGNTARPLVCVLLFG